MTENFSLNEERMRAAISQADAYIEDLRDYVGRANRELYVETLGIGEDDIETARQVVNKFKDKARGGGQIAVESSAVGFLEACATWMEAYRDNLQSELDNYLGTEQQNTGTFTGQDV
ncbi:MAG: hypothetical protein GX542_12200 [Rhodococcus sp.]|nr:hypothetical protein [Rhodococcus sp. (in: high G+C Gram-positive bacteria)]